MYNERKKKWFLLLCVKIPDTRLKAIKGMVVNATLDIDAPIIATCGNNKDVIGNKEEYLYTRLRIQSKLHNLQKALRYANGGHGRKNKLAAIDRFHKKETNYTTTKLHTYSRLLVNFAIKMRAESIVLDNLLIKETETKEDAFLLRNWGYYGLKEMIKYKAKSVGIAVSCN
jgi:IS605 OrfB family transposase